jgi:hypothetical protein
MEHIEAVLRRHRDEHHIWAQLATSREYMKRIASVVLGSWLMSVPAYGNDGSGSNLSVGGRSDPTCAFQSAPALVNATNMSIGSATLSTGQISVDELVDQSTATLNLASIELEMTGVCNQAHTVSLQTTSGGLVPENTASVTGGPFIIHVNYRATVQWGNQTTVLQTNSTPGAKSASGLIPGPSQGVLNLLVNIDSTNNDMNIPLVEGAYSDTLVIQIGQPL